MSKEKIISAENFHGRREALKKEGRRVVLCHGAFDLVHPGHIAHLQEAKGLGDILVVSVTAAKHINKGPGRPYFSDELRLHTLAALECVDHVTLADEPAAFGVIDAVKPDLYVKGAEYEKFEDDITKNIEKEIAAVKKHGGEVYFTHGVVFSSTALINNFMGAFPPEVREFSKKFATECRFSEIRDAIESFSKLKVLVIGDIIIDEYIFCHVQGLMSKDRAFSAKYINEEKYLGGSLAIARHLANFSDDVMVCGMMGAEMHIHTQMLNQLSRSMRLDIQFDPNCKTVVKRRFLEKHGKRNQYEKLFSINYLDDYSDARIDKTSFYKRLEDNVGKFDVVVLSDFGHGMVDEKVMEIVQRDAKFLALNCQTNSSNIGMNLITKYKRADAFTLDEREIRLAYSSKDESYSNLLARLREHLGAAMGWVTLGSAGALGIGSDGKIFEIPAMTLNVLDTVGAGDAFFSLAGLAAKNCGSTGAATCIANIAGAIGANILGNSAAVQKVDVLKFAAALLKV